MGGSALCRTESGACWNGGEAGALAMVQRCSPLRMGEARCNLGNGTLEKTLGRGRVAFVSRAGGVSHGLGCAATLHSHRPSIGESRVRGGVGIVDVTSPGPEKERTP